jgi:hypothetical protein
MGGITGFVGFRADHHYYIYFYSSADDTDEDIRDTVLDELAGLTTRDLLSWKDQLQGKTIDFSKVSTELFGNVYLGPFFTDPNFISLQHLLIQPLLQIDQPIKTLLKKFNCRFFHIIDLDNYTYSFLPNWMNNVVTECNINDIHFLY